MAAPEPAVMAETPAAPRKQRIVFTQSRAAESQAAVRRESLARSRSDVVGMKRLAFFALASFAAIVAAALALPPLCPGNVGGMRGVFCGRVHTVFKVVRDPCPAGLAESSLRAKACALVAPLFFTTREDAKEAQTYAAQLYMHAGGFCVRKDSSQSAHVCGEDAYSVSVSGTAPRSGTSFVAVADGVGGWSESGGDSSKVSIGILSRMAAAVSSAAPDRELDLSAAGADAFAAMRREGGFSRGSTTVCAAALDHGRGLLHVANVGDSGLVVIRGGKVVFRTRPGTDGFNTPHQIGFDDMGNGYGSFAAMATRRTLAAQPGDIVIVVSDGVLDNLYEDEMVAVALAALGPAGDASALADGRVYKRVARPGLSAAALEERASTAATALAMAAYARAKETMWRSPFADGAMAHGYYFAGGKQDDISAVVAVILDS